MAIERIERQQVTGALKATGSSDPDILFARKEELLAGTRKMKLPGILSIAVGAAMCLTILGAVVGIPAILFGMRIRKRIRTNIETAESAYSDYMSALAGRRHTAVA